jgi:iron-sulfur cluster repair protein YtfE (RIC family)
VAYKLDMSMMVAIHGAFRRELEQIERFAGESGHVPGSRLQAALGWELFKKFLLVHHQSEDDVLWPTLRARVAERPDQVALVDALEAEHAVITPLLGAIDSAAADPAQDLQRLGEIVSELRAKLGAHLDHEESDGLPLIDVSLTPAEWQRFSQVHSERLRSDAPMYMPWLLNEASPQTLDAILGKFPPPLLNAFRDEWGPSYAALTVWSGHDKSAA